MKSDRQSERLRARAGPSEDQTKTKKIKESHNLQMDTGKEQSAADDCDLHAPTFLQRAEEQPTEKDFFHHRNDKSYSQPRDDRISAQSACNHRNSFLQGWRLVRDLHIQSGERRVHDE